MKKDNMIFTIIGFIIAIIPYILLMMLINDKMLTNLLTVFGLITSFINAYIFYKKTKLMN